MTDTERLDWLQEVKEASFTQLNEHNDISAVGLFTVPSQHVRGNTVREAIDHAIEVSKTRCRTRWQDV